MPAPRPKPPLNQALRTGVDIYTAAVGRMRQAYEQFDEVVVSCSGGKDSTAVVEVSRAAARQVGRLPVKVAFLDEEVLLPETVAHVEELSADPELEVTWLYAAATYRNSCSNTEPDFVPWEPAKRSVWFRQPHPQGVWPAGAERLPSSWGYQRFNHPAPTCINLLWPGAFMVSGLRVQESPARWMGLYSRGGWLNATTRMGTPIYDWRLGDVWWAVREYGWRYNRAYDRFLRLGVRPKFIRVAPLFGSYACGELATIRQGWPELWPALRLRVAGVAASGNWSGELHEARPGPDGTWRQGLELVLAALAPEDRKLWEKLVANKLALHRRHASGPPDDVRSCPYCNVSWRQLAQRAAAADRHGGRSTLHGPKRVRKK